VGRRPQRGDAVDKTIAKSSGGVERAAVSAGLTRAVRTDALRSLRICAYMLRCVKNDPHEIGPRLLTVGETAHYLSTTKQTVYRLTKTGGLPSLRVGEQLRFDRDELQAWMRREES
jgi:excisionase family DNA binding protein